MSDQPMMKCGHRANAIQSDPVGPCCAICMCTEIDENPPNLKGRIARCSYFGKRATGRNGHGQICKSEAPSDSPNLAFFAHRPERQFDEFYCGCWGWD